MSKYTTLQVEMMSLTGAFFIIFLQGKPTEASKDINVLQYGEKDTRNYLPGNASTCFLYNTMKSCICIGD